MPKSNFVLKFAQAFEEGADPIKKCNLCGREYSPEEFLLLPYVGEQCFPIDDDDEDPACLEYRNCACGTTMTRLVSGTLD